MAVASNQPAVALAGTTDEQEFFAKLRQREFSRLDDNEHVYMDYTGTALYPASLVSRHHRHLQQSILGNPHSINPASENSASVITAARKRILSFFHADPQEYAVIFTASATAAIKLVAEGFPFSDESELLLAADNHNSVNGIREFARRRGAKIRYCPVEPSLGLRNIENDYSSVSRKSPSLFAYPAQSNFSGIQHSLDYIATAQRAGYTVLLDAAAYASGNSLDLSAVRPDFVCISFYKMFGFPTGIGALIVRKQALKMLRRPWFSGGTVDFVSTQHPEVHQFMGDEHAFEDGSPNFTSAQSVIDGLNFLDEIGFAKVRSHTSGLLGQLVEEVNALEHANGNRVVRWYGGLDLTYGSTRALNLLDRSGVVISYELIEKLAGEAGISIRGGCFCNPGCAEAAFGFPPERTLQCMEKLSRERFSPSRFADCLDTTEVGALRVSLGIANNEADVCKFTSFLTKFRQ